MATTPNHITNVAIIGATGQIGKIFTKAILKAGKHKITTISRQESTATIEDDISLVRADYASEESLGAALHGQQALIVCLAIGVQEELMTRIIRAADKAGVLYILPNWYGPDPEAKLLAKDVMIEGMHQARVEAFRACKHLKYVLLACSFWYEFSLAGGPDRFGFDIPKRQFITFDGGKEKINTTTWPQMGNAVASLLSLKIKPESSTDKSTTLEDFANRPMYISSFLISQRDMFESVKRATKTTDTDWTISEQSTKQRYEDGKAGVLAGNWPSFQKMFYSRVFLADGDYETTRGLDNEALGLPKEDFDAVTVIAVEMAERHDIPFADENAGETKSEGQLRP